MERVHINQSALIDRNSSSCLHASVSQTPINLDSILQRNHLHVIAEDARQLSRFIIIEVVDEWKEEKEYHE